MQARVEGELHVCLHKIFLLAMEGHSSTNSIRQVRMNYGRGTGQTGGP